MNDGNPHRRSGGIVVWLLLAGILLLALALRWPGMDDSAYYDEVWTLSHMDAGGFGEFWELQRANDPPSSLIPVYFSMEYLWAQLFGHGIFSARVLSLLFGLGTIALVFDLGRRIFDTRTGLWSAGLLSLSLMHVYYSVEIRMYSFMLFLSALSVWVLIRFVREGSARWGVAQVLVNALLIWTHLFAGLLPLTQGLWLLACRPVPRRTMLVWFSAHATMLACLLVWLRLMWNDGVSDVAMWMTRPGWRELVNAGLVYVGGRPTNWSLAERYPGGFSADIPILLLTFLLAIGVIAMYARNWSRGDAERSKAQHVVLLAAWAAIPPIALFVISQASTSLFAYRYALYSALPVYVLAAAGLTSVKTVGPRRVFAVLLVGLYAYQLSALREPLRPDFRLLARDHIARESAGRAGRLYVVKRHNYMSLVFNEAAIEPYLVEVDSAESLLRAANVGPAPGPEGAFAVLWRADDATVLRAIEEGYSADGAYWAFERVPDHPGYGGSPRMYLYRAVRKP